MPKAPRPLTLALLASVSASVFALDQAVKALVVSSMQEGEIIPVLGNLLQWHFVRNPGAAFSLASGMTWVLTILAFGVVAAIIWSVPRIRSIAWAIMLGGLLGGVLGNLTDRLTREPGFGRGYVIDYISTPWMLPAIYNIADIAIVSSMALFTLLSILGVRLDGTRDRDHRATNDADQAGDRHLADSADDAPESTAAGQSS